MCLLIMYWKDLCLLSRLSTAWVGVCLDTVLLAALVYVLRYEIWKCEKDVQLSVHDLLSLVYNRS